MGEVTLTPPSELRLKGKTSEPVYAEIPKHTINAIERIDNISPVALHIKEVNQIDPIAIDSLRVTGVRNVEPVQIEKLNITNLPSVNLSVRQVPSLDLSVRRVPPLSIGLHQRFDIPSDYLMRASLLGLEVVRVRIQGCSTVVPRDSYRREVRRTFERSFPEVAAGGNAAIPSRHIEQSVTFPGRPQGGCCGSVRVGGPGGARGGLRFGRPASFPVGSSAVRGG